VTKKNFRVQEETMRADPADLNSQAQPSVSPFAPDQERAYRAWREEKIAAYPRSAEEISVAVARLSEPSEREREAIRNRCAVANMALYRTSEEADPRAALGAFGRAFGLRTAEDHRSAERDGIVRIEVVSGGGRLGYIPYTDRPINWHTDGYYNFHGPGRSIQAMLLHCARAAAAGGQNRLLDPEIAYIRLRDEDPELVTALMRADAMTIPENVEPDGRTRPVNVGPVFFIDTATGRLGMRYTARKRNVVWRDDATTLRAAERLEAILNSDPLVLTVRLAPGEGLICNNVLHDRSGFEQGSGEGRLYYRVRYYNRINAA
jgi:hypothetical protein